MLPPGKANSLSSEALAARTTAPVAGKGVSLRPTTNALATGKLSLFQTPTEGTPMNRSRPITVLATAAAILLIAAGVASCGGSSGSGGSSSDPPAAAQSAPAPPAKPAEQAAPAPSPAPAPQVSAPS